MQEKEQTEKKKINRVTYTFIVKIGRRGNNEASEFWVGVQVIEGTQKRNKKRNVSRDERSGCPWNKRVTTRHTSHLPL